VLELGAMGVLNAAYFKSGAVLSAGQDADHCVVSNTAGGQLYYDVDGSGSAAAVAFAKIQPSLALSVADFLVI
jgi:Ca2+-binding RTX toxin-like protein